MEWDWGNGQAFGRILEVFKERVQRTIGGTEVVRNASNDNPAYLIEQIDGQSEVLKSHQELSEVRKDTLYEWAKENDLEGRSQMSKDELAKAAKS